jgi:hypothetical protein
MRLSLLHTIHVYICVYIYLGVGLIEELLPGLDFIPTATIAWLLENSAVGRNLAQAFSTDPAQPSSSAQQSDSDSSVGDSDSDSSSSTAARRKVKIRRSVGREDAIDVDSDP